MKGIKGLVSKLILLGSGLGAMTGAGCIPESVNVRMPVEYKYMKLGEPINYVHTTHPDDASFMPGNPGTTTLTDVHMINIGVDFSTKTSVFEPYVGGKLCMVYADDRHQNDNDTRSAGNGSFVYSKLIPFSPQVNTGVRVYPFKKLSIGGEISATLYTIEHGWDRYSEDDSVSMSSSVLIEAGARIRYEYDKNEGIELGIFKGLNGDTIAGSASWTMTF